MSTNRIKQGAASELIVASDLLIRGFAVYMAVGGGKADLVAIDELGTTYKIQVKTARMLFNAKQAQATTAQSTHDGVKTYESHEVDIFAFYVPNTNTVHYFLLSAVATHKCTFSLDEGEEFPLRNEDEK